MRREVHSLELPVSGGAARRLRGGGAAAGLLPRYRQQAVPGRNAPAAPRPHGWPGRPPVAGQSLTGKDHHQGRTSSLRCGRSTLTVIFSGKTSAPYQEDGGGMEV